MEHYLDEKLKKYTAGKAYPFHMPGHKRQPMDDWRPELLDITEISGFDDLHHAEGILAEAQERMAQVCGSGKGPDGRRFASYFLVNGSTAGILAAISAAAKTGDTVLVARNCHKSVYHAIYLRRLRAEYVWPMETDWGIQGSIDPAAVEAWFEAAPDGSEKGMENCESAKCRRDCVAEGISSDETAEKMPDMNGMTDGKLAAAMILTSPTYDGVVSDIAAIAKIAHRHGAALIVDEAHGAHFGFSEGFPQKAIALGADYVIESMHKTLPALTQSAVIHAAESPYVDRERLEFFLQVYQTSSPSYLLMAGLDRCSRILAEHGKELFEAYEARLRHFYTETSQLRRLQVLPAGPGRGIFDREPSKILIRVRAAEIGEAPGNSGEQVPSGRECPGQAVSGEELFAILRDRFGLELEMAAGAWATALTSIMDTEEGFGRLLQTVKTLDAEFCGEDNRQNPASGRESDVESVSFNGSEERSASVGEPTQSMKGCSGENVPSDDKKSELYQKTEAVMTVFEAVEAQHMWLPVLEAEGKISGGFVFLYPPGIPILAPGERIQKQVCDLLKSIAADSQRVYGLREGFICVC